MHLSQTSCNLRVQLAMIIAAIAMDTIRPIPQSGKRLLADQAAARFTMVTGSAIHPIPATIATPPGMRLESTPGSHGFAILCHGSDFSTEAPATDTETLCEVQWSTDRTDMLTGHPIADRAVVVLAPDAVDVQTVEKRHPRNRATKLQNSSRFQTKKRFHLENRSAMSCLFEIRIEDRRPSKTCSTAVRRRLTETSNHPVVHRCRPICNRGCNAKLRFVISLGWNIDGASSDSWMKFRIT